MAAVGAINKRDNNLVHDKFVEEFYYDFRMHYLEE